MWGSNQELDAAERRINDWQAGIDKRAADAAVLSRRIAGGDAVRVDAQAYGYLCVLVPVLLDVLQHLVVGGIDAAVDSLHDTGERVRIAAQAYQDIDQASQAVSDQVRTGR